jgi:glycosidase
MEEGSKLEDLRTGGLLYLYRTLANDFVYPNPEALVIFADNHDMSRIFTQLGEDYALFKMAMAYVLTMRGVPQIYYGTEILMANREAEDHGIIRGDFPGGWNGDRSDAMSGKGLSPLKVEAQNYVRRLLNWRKDAAAVHSGKLTHFRPEDGVYVYFRYLEDQGVMVVLNKNHEPSVLDLDRFAERLEAFPVARNVISGEWLTLGPRLTAPPRSPLILELRPTATD